MENLTPISSCKVVAVTIVTTVVRPYLDLLWIWQLDAASFCENYQKLYFDVKHVEKGLNRDWQHFWCSFFKTVPLLANIGHCPNFLG